jgi:hypothetical protein
MLVAFVVQMIHSPLFLNADVESFQSVVYLAAVWLCVRIKENVNVTKKSGDKLVVSISILPKFRRVKIIPNSSRT